MQIKSKLLVIDRLTYCFEYSYMFENLVTGARPRALSITDVMYDIHFDYDIRISNFTIHTIICYVVSFHYRNKK